MPSVPRSVPDEELFNRIIEELSHGRKVALAVIVEKVGSGPRNAGSKMLVLENGSTVGTLGGGPFERDVVDKALEAIRKGKPLIVKYDFTGHHVKGAVDTGLICGGVLTVYIDVLKPSPRIYIVGAGRIGGPLAEILGRVLNYNIVIMDPLKELANRESFPYAREVLYGEPSDIARYIVENAREHDIVLVVHGEINIDYPVLKASLRSKAGYIGLLGSRRKVIEFVKRLVKEGLDYNLIKNKLHAPIGIDIGGETPEEVALSIAAEVVSWIRGRGGYKPLNIVGSEIMERALEPLKQS